jgi:hypothetical protein
MKFNFVVDTPVQEQRPQQQRESNVDWEAVNNYQAEVLGIGKQMLMGRIVQLYDLGIQERQEQVILWDASGQKDHGWRLEVWEDSGTQKDASARLEQRKYKGKMEECLVFQPQDVAQMAIAVDFPEKMLNLSQFFNPEGEQSEKPFRDIIGQNGFGGFRVIDGKRTNLIAKPFNLIETNVNRAKKDAPVHKAFAKNSMIHDLADYCGVLVGDDNFHIADISTLLGKVCMFEVEVKWNTWKDKTSGEERRKLETDIRPASRMSPRDEAYFNSDIKPNLDEDVLGGLLFSGGNRERDLKEVRAIVLNTMQLAKTWEDSKLKVELDAVKTSNGGEASKPVSKAPVSTAGKSSSEKSNSTPVNTVQKQPEPVADVDFDDDKYPF